MSAPTLPANSRPAAQPLRTAIVGGLQAIKALLPAFEAVPDFQVVALGARNPGSLRDAAARLGVTKIHAGWEPLVDDPEIEVVALALPAAVQAQAAPRLAAAGKHLFCEKPLATILSDAERIVSAVAAARRQAVVHLGFRFVSAFEAFREIARSGELGRPQLVKVEWLISARNDPSFSWNWKSDAAQGGGTWFLMAPHVLDYLAWWFGGIRDLELLPTTMVTARPDAATGSPKPVLADDTCNLLLSLGESVPASVTIATALSVGANHRVRVWFKKGLLELANRPGDDAYDGFQLSFQPSRRAGATPPLTAQLVAESQTPRAPTTRVIIARRSVEALAAAIRGGGAGESSLAAALEVQRWLEKGRRDSARWNSASTS